MNQKIILDNKNIYFYIIPYLMVCSALYHISYWEKFGLNGLSYIGISEIIKSAIYPIYSTVLPFILQLTIGAFIIEQPTVSSNSKNISNEKFYFIGIGVIFLVFLIFQVLGYNKSPESTIYIAMLFSIFVQILLSRIGVFQNLFDSYKIRNYVILVMVTIPIMSVAAGRRDGENIYRNIKFKYITLQTRPNKSILMNANDTLKLLGITDKHFIFSNLLNNKILFIKSDNLDTMVILNK